MQRERYKDGGRDEGRGTERDKPGVRDGNSGRSRGDEAGNGWGDRRECDRNRQRCERDGREGELFSEKQYILMHIIYTQIHLKNNRICRCSEIRFMCLVHISI
jgi:hypothetical protein